MKRGRPKTKRATTQGKSFSESLKILSAGSLAEREECDTIRRLHDVLTADPRDKFQQFPADFVEKCKNEAAEVFFQAIKSNDDDLLIKIASWLQVKSSQRTDDPAALLVRVFAEEISACGGRPTGENIAIKIKAAFPSKAGLIDPRQIYRILADLGLTPKGKRDP